MSTALLYAHIISFALVLLVAGGVHVSEIQMARAESIAVARNALRVGVAAGAGFGIGSALLLITGFSLAQREVNGAQVDSPWVITAAIALFLLNGFGAGVLGRRNKMLLDKFENVPDGPPSPEQRALLHDRLLSVGGWSGTGLALGIAFLMVRKPAGPGSVVALVLATAVGAVVGAIQYVAVAERAGEAVST